MILCVYPVFNCPWFVHNSKKYALVHNAVIGIIVNAQSTIIYIIIN